MRDIGYGETHRMADKVSSQSGDLRSFAGIVTEMISCSYRALPWMGEAVGVPGSRSAGIEGFERL